MSKYHINPKTGNASICKAKNSCPFGDLIKDHYESLGEAQKAYENSNNSFNRNYNKRTIEYYYSHILKEQSEELLKNFISEGKFIPPSENDTRDKGNFKYLGAGGETNVYLSPDGMTVYKIPNACTVSEIDEDYYKNLKRYHKIKQMRYASLNKSLLEIDNVEYAKTYFLNVKTEGEEIYPIHAQEYLSENKYFKPDQMSSLNPFINSTGDESELAERLREFGINDFITENFKLTIRGHKIVLFDCLDIGDEDYWPYNERVNIDE